MRNILSNTDPKDERDWKLEDSSLEEPETSVETMVQVKVSPEAITVGRDYRIAVTTVGHPTAYLVPKSYAISPGTSEIPLSILQACPVAKDFGPRLAQLLPTVEDVLRVLYLYGAVDDKTTKHPVVVSGMKIALPSAKGVAHGL